MSVLTLPKVSVSSGNRKVGAIPSFNLPPVESCLNSATCAKFVDDAGISRKCYALHPYVSRPNVTKAWSQNFEAAKHHLVYLERSLILYFKRGVARLFRIHTSGDFFSKEYLAMWLRVISRFPSVKFLAYTKVYGFFKGLTLPKNFVVILSYMPSIPVEQAIRFSGLIGLPMAYASSKNPGGNFISCPEQVLKKSGRNMTCAECQICWKLNELKRPTNIHFYTHR